jgi:hypothetical protein
MLHRAGWMILPPLSRMAVLIAASLLLLLPAPRIAEA